MKVKIKGLVFVGFAAAILSANAMAANEAQTVTSKAYTEATYQHKSTKPSIGGADGTWTDLDAEIPSDPANASANTAPTTKAVAEALDDLTEGLEQLTTDAQVKSTANYQLGGTGGSWKTLQAGIYIATPVQGTTANDAKIDIDKMMVVGSKSGVTNGTNQLTTAEGVKAYAQKISEDPNQVSDGDGGWKSLGTSLDSSDAVNYDADNAVTAATIVGALSDKQDKDTTNIYKVGLNGAWANVNAAVADTGTHITTTNEADGSVVINVSDTTNVAAGITDSSTALTEGKAVYEYVQSITNGNTLPAQDSTVCTSAIPCALVNEAGNLNWRTMATATHAGGVCGNASGQCPGSGDTGNSGSGTSGNNNG